MTAHKHPKRDRMMIQQQMISLFKKRVHYTIQQCRMMKDHQYEVDVGEQLLDERRQPHQTLQYKEELDGSYPSLNNGSLQAQDEQQQEEILSSPLPSQQQQQEQIQEPKLYIRRWFQLAIFALCMVTSIICMSTYTTSG